MCAHHMRKKADIGYAQLYGFQVLNWIVAESTSILINLESEVEEIIESAICARHTIHNDCILSFQRRSCFISIQNA